MHIFFKTRQNQSHLIGIHNFLTLPLSLHFWHFLFHFFHNFHFPMNCRQPTAESSIPPPAERRQPTAESSIPFPNSLFNWRWHFQWATDSRILNKAERRTPTSLLRTNYLRLPIADSRQPNPQHSRILNTAERRQPTAERRQPTAESSIQPNPQYNRILNPFSEQIIYGYR